MRQLIGRQSLVFNRTRQSRAHLSVSDHVSTNRVGLGYCFMNSAGFGLLQIKLKEGRSIQVQNQSRSSLTMSSANFCPGDQGKGRSEPIGLPLLLGARIDGCVSSHASVAASVTSGRTRSAIADNRAICRPRRVMVTSSPACSHEKYILVATMDEHQSVNSSLFGFVCMRANIICPNLKKQVFRSEELGPHCRFGSVSYTHLRAHETDSYLVCRL